jgi:hypothetical protein
LQKKLVVVLSTTLYADSPVLLTIALPIWDALAPVFEELLLVFHVILLKFFLFC